MKTSAKRLLQATVSAVCFMCAANLMGADILWDGSSSPDWNTGANWTGNVVPGADDVAVFDPAQQAISRWNFRLDADAAISGIRFSNLTYAVTGDASGDFALSIGSNGVSVAGADVTLDLACEISADQRWSVAEGDELIHSGELRGDSKLIKSGAGRAWLTGESAFKGEYRVEQGILKGAVFNAPVMDGLEVWMDAAATDTIVTNVSGQVTSWTDKAGSEVMTPIGAGGGPIYGGTLFNGRPGMRFDKDINNGLLMTSGYANTTNVATAFVMMQRRSAQTAYAGLLSLYKNGLQDYNNVNSGVFYRFAGSAPYYTLYCDRNNANGSEANVPHSTPVCLMSRFNGTNHDFVQDGVIPGKTWTDSKLQDNFNADRLILGNRPVAGYTYPFNGDVAEVLVYNRVLTAAEEQQVAEYLVAKWKPVESVEDVLNDAALWFDASNIDSITTNAAGVITSWNNLVSENQLVPLTTTNYPAFVEESVNGLPAVRFSKDVFNSLQSNGGYANRGDELTFFVSLTAEQDQNLYAGVASVVGSGYDHNNNANGILMYLRDQATGLQWSGYRNGQGLSYSYTTPGVPAVAMSRYDGAEHTLVVNGDAVGTAFASQGNFNSYIFRLGDRIEAGNRPFNGNIHEVLVFNRRLSPAEEQLVTDYLDKKWVATTNISDILADADVHLDASAASSIMTNATGSVTNWANLAGSSIMTVPTAGHNGPLLVPGAMNGKPALRFSPARSTSLFMAEGYTNTEAQVNAFIVMRRNADQVANAGLLSIYASSAIHDYNNGSSAILAYYNNNDTISGYRNSGLRSSITDIPYNATVCLHSGFNGLAHTMSLNNGRVNSSGYLGKLNSDRLCLGSRYEGSIFKNHFSGDVAEVLIYNRALSQAEKELINDYLTAKWMPQTSASQLDSILNSAELWLDASDAANILTDGNGQVSAWSNLVDNSAEALLPATGLNGPMVYAGGMNGKPVLRFDKDAATKQALMIDNGFAITGMATTAVIMMQTRSTQSGGARLANLWKDNGTDHDNVAGCVYGYFANATTLKGHRNKVGLSGYAGLPFETPICIFSRYDGSRHRMIKDDSLATPANSSGEFNANRFGLGFRLGVNEWFNGDIAEVLVFNYALNPDQQQIIYAYLQDKWVKPDGSSTLSGVQLIEINSGAELDVRDVNGLTLNDGARLSGAGSVAGDVTVTSGGAIEAVNEGTDNTLAVTGALTFESGATVAIDYLDGKPLITAGGLLTLPATMTYATTNLVTSGRSGKVPVLRGGAWDDGAGGAPVSSAWVLDGDAKSTSFLLDADDFSVNLQILGGTIILVR